MTSPRYSFRKVIRDDLGLIHRWLAEPHVRRWWGDPDEQLALIAADIHGPDMGCYIVTNEGCPFAYIQWWHTHTYDEYLDQPMGTRGIDPFIGELDMVGCGHGHRFIAAFVERLFADGASRVIIDPDPENQAAIRAYEKAGFLAIGVRDTRDGPVLLMAINTKET